MNFLFALRSIQPCLIAGLTLFIHVEGLPAGDRPPNIVLIVADDMGYADIGCYGARDFETPHLDRMAADGLKLTNFYAAASICSPSRAALMTGRYPDRIGITEDFSPTRAADDQPAGHGKDGLSPDEITVAEILRKEGYATACIGKWHLGDAPEFLPARQGFDEYFGIPYSNNMGWWQGNPPEFNKDFPPIPIVQNETVIETNPDQRFLTKRYTEHAVRFIRKHKEKPFFLYLSHSMPHVPLFVTERFSGSAKYGLYGDVIQEIDWSVGVIRRALEMEGVAGNTLLVFTSDNGPWLSKGAHAGKADPLRDGKFTRYEGGHRVPCLMHWPEKLKAGIEIDGIASMIDFLPTFAGLAGAEIGDELQIDGLDLWPYLSGKVTKSPRNTFFYSQWVVRRGKWKLLMPGKYRDVIPAQANAENGMVNYEENRLFDLEADIGEKTSLHKKEEHQELVKELTQLCIDYQKDLNGVEDPDAEETEEKPK